MSPADPTSAPGPRADEAPVDLDALTRWMDLNGLGEGPVTDVVTLTGGTQNILLRFERAGRSYVLRHPPRAKRANSDETMRREARVLSALAGSEVPHAALIAACGDESVLGSAFYLMEPVEGVNVFDTGMPEVLRDAESQAQLASSMVDALAALGRVDHIERGLGDFGRPEGWHARQVDRWSSQLDSYSDLEGYTGPDLPGHLTIAEWLRAHQPEGGRLGLIHGDYHFANVLVAAERPEVLAVIDWELATIGDPLLDLGHLLSTWPNTGDAQLAVEGTEEMPGVDVVIDRYARGTGFDLSDLAWFRVLAAYRLAVLLEGTHARAAAGHAPVEVGERLHRKSVALCGLAQQIIDQENP